MFQKNKYNSIIQRKKFKKSKFAFSNKFCNSCYYKNSKFKNLTKYKIMNGCNHGCGRRPDYQKRYLYGIMTIRMDFKSIQCPK